MVDPATLTSLGLGALLVFLLFYFLMNPEKVQIWSALVAKALAHLGRFFKGAHKHYVKFDTQGRINEFTKRLSKEAPFLGATQCRIEWAEGELDKKTFLKNDEVIIRLRRDDPQELNFVHGAYHFVSTALLHRAKRYISPSHRESIDLFVTTELLRKEKASLVSLFLDEYLHPATADPSKKVTVFFDKFSRIDKGGLFYNVLLQELDFLGAKVFGGRRDDQIIVEVNGLVDFLETLSQRRIGELGDLNFDKTYCRFGLVIVGKSFKVAQGAQAYITYIRKNLVANGIETIYLLGSVENEQTFEEIAQALDDRYDVHRRQRHKAVLHAASGAEIESRQAVFILRLRGAAVFEPSS